MAQHHYSVKTTGRKAYNVTVNIGGRYKLVIDAPDYKLVVPIHVVPNASEKARKMDVDAAAAT